MNIDPGYMILALIGILITIIGWFITQTMQQINMNQKEMFKKLEKFSEVTVSLGNRVTTLEVHTEFCRNLNKEMLN